MSNSKVNTNIFPIHIGCLKLSSIAKLPTKSHIGIFEDAAYDLYATKDILLQPTHREMIGTGLSFVIPDGYWIKLRERSGLASKGIHLLGGVIDPGYIGETKVILYNSSTEPIKIPIDKAICQFTLEKIIKSDIVELTQIQFNNDASLRERGSNGFGSTDDKTK